MRIGKDLLVVGEEKKNTIQWCVIVNELGKCNMIAPLGSPLTFLTIERESCLHDWVCFSSHNCRH